MNQAYNNDKLIEAGQPVDEQYDAPNDKVLVWPDLVYVELITIVLFSAFMLVWSIGLPAPLEEPANPSESPNPAKAPWYFLGLQEMLVYFDPWFGWLVLWNLLIVIGTVLRGPNWNFFGPFEFWDSHKVEALTNINLSEFVYVKWMSTGLPGNILLREIWGIILLLGYFMILPPLLAKTWLKNLFERLGVARYSLFIVLILAALTLPIKMYLRWMFNLKYIISIPEYFFNF